MNWIDTPLLVYASLAEHPARDTVAAELRSGAWASTVLALPECYHVLTRDYAVEPEQAARVVSALERTGIAWASTDSSQIAAGLDECWRHGLQATDAVLLALARADGGTVVTTDRRFLRVAQSEGLAVRNPVTPGLALAVARWEDQRFAPKGLARVLHSTARWLRAEEPGVADRFVEATDQLRQPPT